MINATEQERVDLEHKIEIFMELKSLLQPSNIPNENDWHKLCSNTKKYGLTFAQLFHNLKYSNKAQKDLISAIYKGFKQENIQLMGLRERTSDFIHKVFFEKKLYALNLIAVIDYELAILQKQLSEMPSEPTADIDTVAAGTGNAEATPTQPNAVKLGPKKESVIASIPRNPSSACCSESLKTCLAATALISLGSLLTSASMLTYIQYPAVAVLVSLHAPQALLIGLAVAGALMTIYGLYLAIRTLCIAAPTQEIVINRGPQTPSGVDESGRFFKAAPASKASIPVPVQPLEPQM